MFDCEVPGVWTHLAHYAESSNKELLLIIDLLFIVGFHNHHVFSTKPTEGSQASRRSSKGRSLLRIFSRTALVGRFLSWTGGKSWWWQYWHLSPLAHLQRRLQKKRQGWQLPGRCSGWNVFGSIVASLSGSGKDTLLSVSSSEISSAISAIILWWWILTHDDVLESLESGSCLSGSKFDLLDLLIDSWQIWTVSAYRSANSWFTSSRFEMETANNQWQIYLTTRAGCKSLLYVGCDLPHMDTLRICLNWIPLVAIYIYRYIYI